MLSFENATMPAAQNTSTPRTMIALRVRPNTRRDLIKRDRRAYSTFPDTPRRSTCVAQQQLVAQKHRTLGDDSFARLKALHDLHPAILPEAGRHGALDEMALVVRDPYCHRAVTLARHAVGGHGQRRDRITDPRDEARIHSRSQQVVGIVDLGADKLATRVGIDR